MCTVDHGFARVGVGCNGDAVTVTSMTVRTAPGASSTLTLCSALALGDVITLPDGASRTIRSVMLALPHAVGSMHGFAVAGDIGPATVLLSLPADPSTPVGVFRPVDKVPAAAAHATVVCSGTLPFWAPHLPGLRQALGQLGYKVCVVRGQAEPMVLLWRGRELVVFVHSADTSGHDITVQQLRRDEHAVSAPVSRVAAAVASPDRVAPATTTTSPGLYERFTAGHTNS